MRYHGQFVMGTAADTYIRCGFCPDMVRITDFTTRICLTWARVMGLIGVAQAAAGTGTQDTDAVSLVAFSENPEDLSSAPSDIEAAQWYNANGFRIDAGVAAIPDASLCYVEAWGSPIPMVPLVHDGGSTHLFIQDSSVDLVEAGVVGNGDWIVINTSNDNYAFLGAISKPSGQTKYCKALLYEDANLTTATAAADIADADVLVLMRHRDAQYPLSGIGLMT